VDTGEENWLMLWWGGRIFGVLGHFDGGCDAECSRSWFWEGCSACQSTESSWETSSE
jgi:hypothetical protein